MSELQVLKEAVGHLLNNHGFNSYDYVSITIGKNSISINCRTEIALQEILNTLVLYVEIKESGLKTLRISGLKIIAEKGLFAIENSKEKKEIIKILKEILFELSLLTKFIKFLQTQNKIKRLL